MGMDTGPFRGGMGMFSLQGSHLWDMVLSPKLARALEGKDLAEWNLADFEVLADREDNLCLITLVANSLFEHKIKPIWMTRRDLTTFLQSQSRTETMFGAWSDKYG